MQKAGIKGREHAVGIQIVHEGQSLSKKQNKIEGVKMFKVEQQQIQQFKK